MDPTDHDDSLTNLIPSVLRRSNCVHVSSQTTQAVATRTGRWWCHGRSKAPSPPVVQTEQVGYLNDVEIKANQTGMFLPRIRTPNREVPDEQQLPNSDEDSRSHLDFTRAVDLSHLIHQLLQSSTQNAAPFSLLRLPVSLGRLNSSGVALLESNIEAAMA